MKNLTNILLLSLVVLTTTIGCSDLKFGDNFLEKAPGVDMTIDSIFSRKLYADRALTGAYATMQLLPNASETMRNFPTKVMVISAINQLLTNLAGIISTP